MSPPRPYTTLLVLCSLLHLPGSSVGSYVESQNLTAPAGGDATLKCQLLVQDTKVIQVNWNLCNDVHMASHINDYKTEGAVVGNFTERVSLAEDYGIKISNVKSSDARFYCCVFNTFPRGKFTGKIYLEVLAAESSMWTREHISWIILPCGILLLTAGCLATFYHMRRSRRTHDAGKPNSSPVTPTNSGTPSSVPAASAAQDGDDSQRQEYFNVIAYSSLPATINM